jgi:uncharacterized protein (TIGR02145 family)
MKKTILILVALLFIGYSLDSKPKEKPGQKKFEKFFDKFYEAYFRYNDLKLSELISFGNENPVDFEGENPIANSDMFFNNWTKIFTDEMNEFIKNSSEKDFYASDEEGFLWRTLESNNLFIQFCDYGKGWKLVNCTGWKSIKQNIELDNKSKLKNVEKTLEVTIGSQIWITNNLDVDHYRNGDSIPQVKDPSHWANLKTGAWCYYDNGASNFDSFGKLYNWYAVNDPRGLAPIGWHIPSDQEWTILVNYIGGLEVAGGKLKEIGNDHWSKPNIGATNEYNFFALPGGLRNIKGQYEKFLSVGYFWTSTEYSKMESLYRYVGTNYMNMDAWHGDKEIGMSVRLIKDK